MELDQKIQNKFGLQPKMNEGIRKLNNVVKKISFFFFFFGVRGRP